MTNSDYLLKAAIKKVTEKLNEIVVEKIEEATNIAQDAPEILKKEFDILKESIMEEASRMEKADNIQENEPSNTYQNDQLREMFFVDLLLGHIEKSIAVETLYFS